MTKLWDKVEMGSYILKNRLAMAPMTRSRAKKNGVPGDLAPLYYAQRASMGLIITEGTQPSDEGQGYLFSPGIYTNEQIEGWRKVTDAVHEKGGRIFIQLMHVGRMSHPDNTVQHQKPVAPSAVAPDTTIFTSTGMQEVPTPRELTRVNIKNTIEDFRRAASAAIKAGADGVEIHGANGYLIHQFLGDNSNLRSDEYGGSIENRTRFGLEVAKAVVREIGSERTGFRISPMNLLGNVNEGVQGVELYRYLVKELNKLNLSYLHVMHTGNEELLKDIRKYWGNTLIVNRAGRPLADIAVDIDSGIADIVSVGQWALANPDLVDRLKKGLELNNVDNNTVYAGTGEVGYTDYPTLQDSKDNM